MLSHVKMQVESVRENAVAQAKLHAEAEKKEVGAHNSDFIVRNLQTSQEAIFIVGTSFRNRILQCW